MEDNFFIRLMERHPLPLLLSMALAIGAASLVDAEAGALVFVVLVCVPLAWSIIMWVLNFLKKPFVNSKELYHYTFIKPTWMRDESVMYVPDRGAELKKFFSKSKEEKIQDFLEHQID